MSYCLGVIMIGFFKKKDKGMSQPEDPPLPDQLPPKPGDTSSQRSGLPEMPPLPNQGPEPSLFDMPPIPDKNANMQAMPEQRNTHDMIPNDIELNQPYSEQLSPDNLPDMDNLPERDNLSSNMADEPKLPNPEKYEEIPKHVESHLPKLPKMPEIKEPNASTLPLPEIDEEVPTPPPIFSEDSFYDTPEEIKHMVKDKKGKRIVSKDYIDKYNLNESEDRYEDRDIDKDDILQKRNHEIMNGPIFVDIDSFMTILGDVESIKNKVTASDDILQHLKEIKTSKDRELSKWRGSLEDIQRKMNYIDKTIFEKSVKKEV